MKSVIRCLLEYIGIGILIFSVPALFIYLLRLAVGFMDSIMSPVVTFLFGRPIPLVGFLIFITFCGIIGAFLRSDFGWTTTMPIIDRVILLKLIVYGARSGTLRRALRSRGKDASNTILAPYYRTGGPWPFVILRIAETTDPDDPLIWGTFLDLPFIYKPYTVNAKDSVLADITFDEALFFAFNGGGIGLGKNPKKPRKVLLADYLQEKKFKEFMEQTG